MPPFREIKKTLRHERPSAVREISPVMPEVSPELASIGDRTERHGSIFLCQAVIGILGHPQGDLHADPRSDHLYRVPEVDVLEEVGGN